jgi:hypothetical protein
LYLREFKIVALEMGVKARAIGSANMLVVGSYEEDADSDHVMVQGIHVWYAFIYGIKHPDRDFTRSAGTCARASP